MIGWSPHKRGTTQNEKGFILILTMMIMMVLILFAGTALYFSTLEIRMTNNQTNKRRSFFLADGAIDYVLTLANNYGSGFASWLSAPENSTLKNDGINYRTLPGLSELSLILGNTLLEPVIEGPAEGPYQVSIEADYHSSRTAIMAEMSPEQQPSYVFDYTYFINNWGWFYGSGITANGDIRSNGDFDFRWGPKVDGEIYAAGDIVADGHGIKGTGGDPLNQHENQDNLSMPNLKDLSYYEDLARLRGGTLKYWVEDAGEYRMLHQVFGDDEDKESLYLKGTSSHPIILDGPVVVEGDLIISGKVIGQGTIYIGGNAYLTDDIEYKNLTGGAPRPASDDPSVVDQWVEAHKDDDLMAVAARGNIILGDYTGETGGYWYANWYLFQMGNEDGIGLDGIPDTYDDESPDGVLQSYEDVDGDDQLDGNYTWSDIATDLSGYDNIPDGITRFGQLATNLIHKIEGIFYTNHAFTGRTGYGMIIDGSVISKDEAIIYRNNITFNYDERVHSRYLKDPNLFIDLGLPKIRSIVISSWRML